MKLNGRFSAQEVLAAIDVYTDRASDIPQPADLIKIMTPEKPKITQAEFIYAQKQHALEGYPMHGYYGQIIKDYEKQMGEETGVPSYYEILERRKAYALENKGAKLIQQAMIEGEE